MSAGAYIRSRYQASYGTGANVHPIRIQPETVGLQFGTFINIPPIASANNPISAVVSRGKRAKGLGARKVTFKFVGATPVNGTYKADSPITLPWLTPFPTEFVAGLEGTYLGEAITLVSISPEEVR